MLRGKQYALPQKYKIQRLSNKNTKQQKEKICSYIPQLAWVQILGTQPRLLKNSGLASVPAQKKTNHVGHH